MFWGNLSEGIKKSLDAAAVTIQTQATSAAQQYMTYNTEDGEE